MLLCEGNDCTYKSVKSGFTLIVSDFSFFFPGFLERRGCKAGFAVMRFRLIFGAVFLFFVFYSAVLRFL